MTTDTVYEQYPHFIRCRICHALEVFGMGKYATAREAETNILHMGGCPYDTQPIEDEIAYETLRSMPYREYLQTVHWQQVRQVALDHANHRCQVCNSSKITLHVHHRTYENRGRELDVDVIALCAHCHKIFHENRRVK